MTGNYMTAHSSCHVIYAWLIQHFLSRILLVETFQSTWPKPSPKGGSLWKLKWKCSSCSTLTYLCLYRLAMHGALIQITPGQLFPHRLNVSWCTLYELSKMKLFSLTVTVMLILIFLNTCLRNESSAVHHSSVPNLPRPRFTFQLMS